MNNRPGDEIDISHVESFERNIPTEEQKLEFNVLCDRVFAAYMEAKETNPELMDLIEQQMMNDIKEIKAGSTGKENLMAADKFVSSNLDKEHKIEDNTYAVQFHIVKTLRRLVASSKLKRNYKQEVFQALVYSSVIDDDLAFLRTIDAETKTTLDEELRELQDPENITRSISINELTYNVLLSVVRIMNRYKENLKTQQSD